MEGFRTQLRVALQLVPRRMKRNGGDLGDIVALLEQPRRGFVPQVVETQVLDPERAAGAGKGRAYGFRVVGEDPVFAGDLRLSLHQVPGFAQQRERPMVADLGAGVLCVPEHRRPLFAVQIRPQQPGDFAFPLRREDGEGDDIAHRNG